MDVILLKRWLGKNFALQVSSHLNCKLGAPTPPANFVFLRLPIILDLLTTFEKWPAPQLSSA